MPRPKCHEIYKYLEEHPEDAVAATLNHKFPQLAVQANGTRAGVICGSLKKWKKDKASCIEQLRRYDAHSQLNNHGFFPDHHPVLPESIAGPKNYRIKKLIKKVGLEDGDLLVGNDQQSTSPMSNGKPTTRINSQVGGEPMQMSILISNAGLRLKVCDDHGVIGTLVITRNGTSFIRANGKKEPKFEIDFESLDIMSQRGVRPKF